MHGYDGGKLTFFSLNTAAREEERAALVGQARALGAKTTDSFHEITTLASEIFQVPIAVVTLVDSETQWLESCVGLSLRAIEKRHSLCDMALTGSEPTVIEDAATDARFATHPLVLGDPFVRFYAGAPIVLSSGVALGSFCLIDTKPKRFGARARSQLRTLAGLVATQIELHLKVGRTNEITRLPNRAQMAEDINARQIVEPGGSRAMLLLDLVTQDRVQDAARAVGIEAIEKLLVDAAANLKRIVGQDWPVYHIGEMRFCVRMRGKSREERETFSRNVIESLEAPFKSDGVLVKLEVAAGLVEFTLDERGGVDPLRKATSALLEARARGNRWRWHDDALDAAHRRAHQLIRDVSAGLARGEFRLVYQPKYNVREARFSGVEALARWRHPDFGDVSPGEFIPLVEQTALIQSFTRWAIFESLAQAARWQRMNIYLTVAVNVSAVNLDQPSFVSDIRAMCERAAIDPQWLHVECTESSVMTSELTRQAVKGIRALGAQVSLDDFGMGYSNLACLRSLPVQLIKLDQSLIKPIDSDPSALKLVTALIDLGQSFGFRVLAEGVETKQACALLLGAGCDAMQGYYFSKPLEVEAVPLFMHTPPAVVDL